MPLTTSLTNFKEIIQPFQNFTHLQELSLPSPKRYYNIGHKAQVFGVQVEGAGTRGDYVYDFNPGGYEDEQELILKMVCRGLPKLQR
jgi:hypothetical protein